MRKKLLCMFLVTAMLSTFVFQANAFSEISIEKENQTAKMSFQQAKERMKVLENENIRADNIHENDVYEMYLQQNVAAELDRASLNSALSNNSSPEDAVFTPYAEPYNSPYKMINNDAENIGLTNGTLNYTYNILSFPGKNGFDLKLNLTYNSASSMIGNDNFVNGFNSATGLGVGWRYNVSNIDMSGTVYYMLTLSDGRMFRLEKYTGAQTPRTVTVYDQHVTDFTVTAYSHHTCVEYKDGRIEELDEEGYLTSQTDRFGNTITYEYTSPNTTYLYNTYEAKLLSKITDSFGRVINFNYTYRSVSSKNSAISKVTITSGDVTYAVLKLQTMLGYGSLTDYDVLSEAAICENEAGETQYPFTFDYTVSISHAPQIESYPLNFLLTSVNYYTGGCTKYTYDEYDEYKYGHMRISEDDGAYTYMMGSTYKITSRAEYYFTDSTYPQNTIKYYYEKKPVKTFDPVTGDFENSNHRYYTIAEIFGGTDAPNVSHKTVYTFNNLNLKIREQTIDTYAIDYISDEDFSPDGNTVPNTAWDYAGKSMFFDSNENITMKSDGNILYINHGGLFFEKVNVNEAENYRGDVTEYVYDSNRQISQITKKYLRGENDTPPPEVQSFVYAKNGDLQSSTDAVGNITSYTYPSVSVGVPKTITQSYANSDEVTALSNTFNTENTRTGQKIIETLTTYSDGLQDKTVYTYSDINNPGDVTKEERYGKKTPSSSLSKLNTTTYLRTVNSENNTYSVTTTLYDSSETAQSAITATDEYYLNTGLIKKQTDALGSYTAYTYLPTFKNALLSKSSSDGSTVNYTYYTQNTSTENALVTVYNNAYYTKDVMDSLGRRTYIYDGEYSTASGLGTAHFIAHMQYTPNRNNIYAITDAEENYNFYFYDDIYGRNTCMWDVTSNTTLITYINYDDAAKTKTTVSHEGNSVKITYDVFGREISKSTYGPQNANLATTVTEYDARGNVSKVTDPLGNATRYCYDGRNNLTKVTNALDYDTKYEYDARGNITKTIFANNTYTTNQYDDFGRCIKAENQLRKYESFTYDKAGNMKSRTDAMGTVTNMEYVFKNGKYLPSYVSYRVNEHEYGRIYPKQKLYVYDNFGNITDITDYATCYTEVGDGNDVCDTYIDTSTEYEYTYDGRLKKITANNEKSMTYTYDGVGNVVSMTDYFGNVYTYTYDSAYRMTGISENGTSTASYTYDGDSRITQSSYRGITHQYTYDNMGRVTSISGNYGNPRTYTYDLAGNLTWIEEYELVKRYVYDEIYQLEKYVETYQSDVLANMTYYYDSVGNLTGRHDTYPNGVTYTENGNTYTLTDYDYYQQGYQYNAANRLEVWYEEFGRVWPDGSYYDVICSRSDYMSYDNNGNMIKKEHYSNMEPNENHTYTYDILNRLEKHTLQGGAVTTYHYGSDGLRDKKTTGGDTIKYYCDENGIVLNEANANGSHRATNVVGADGTIIARKNQSGDIGKFIKNEHGDVTNVIGETASNTYKYEPWGTITAKTGTFDNPIRYSGEYYDDESGLIYLRNRYYDPSLRRFISVDPAKDGLNWYAYCGNNPVNAVDPWGLKDYIYTSQTEYYVENDWGFWEFLNTDRYYAEIDGIRYQANSKETVTLYAWNSFDTNFLNRTLDSLVNKANEQPTDAKRILGQSVGGDLDFKLQMKKDTLYLANEILYNRNEAGNFVWAYFLESKNVCGYISGALAQGGSLIPPLANMNGLPRLDEEWDRKARWAGIKYYYDRNNQWWIYYVLYNGEAKY